MVRTCAVDYPRVPLRNFKDCWECTWVQRIHERTADALSYTMDDDEVTSGQLSVQQSNPIPNAQPEQVAWCGPVLHANDLTRGSGELSVRYRANVAHTRPSRP